MEAPMNDDTRERPEPIEGKPLLVDGEENLAESVRIKADLVTVLYFTSWAMAEWDNQGRLTMPMPAINRDTLDNVLRATKMALGEAGVKVLDAPAKRTDNVPVAAPAADNAPGPSVFVKPTNVDLVQLVAELGAIPCALCKGSGKVYFNQIHCSACDGIGQDARVRAALVRAGLPPHA
jgi:hypothetical protein